MIHKLDHYVQLWPLWARLATFVTHKSRGYQMMDEVISAIKAKPPQTPEQARVANLQKQKDAASKALKMERNRQKIKRAQQQISAARANI